MGYGAGERRRARDRRRTLTPSARWAEGQLTALLDSARDPVWVVDQGHRLVRFNRVFAERYALALGFQPEVGQVFERHLPARVADEWRDRIERVLRGEPVSYEFPMPQGSETIWYQIVISPFREGSTIVGALGIGRDVTERRLAEELLHSQQASLAAAYAAEQQARLASERTGARTERLLGVSAALSAALTPEDVATVITERGFAADDAAAGSLFLLNDHTGLLDTHRSISLTGPEGSTVPLHYPLTRRLPACTVVHTGQPEWFPSVDEMIAAYPDEADFIRPFGDGARAYLPLAADGRTFGVLGMRFAHRRNFDASDMAFQMALAEQVAQALVRARLYEESRRANQLKSELVAMVSHEVRAPLQGILGLTDVLLAAPLDDAQRELAEMVRNAGQGMAAIVDDILDYSRIEAARLALAIDELDVGEVVETVLDVAAEPADRKGLELAAFVDPSLPSPLLGDGLRLRQVLTNLVANAIAFTETGSVVIHATATAITDNAVNLRLSVRDTGPGIALAEQAHLFDAYTQLQSRVARRGRGSGLGLAICRHLIALMGGEIGVDSEPGQGSTFWCAIRLERAPGSTATADRQPLVGRGVLVVSQSPMLREAVRWPIAGAGAVVTCLSDAASATTWLLARRAGVPVPDTMVLDAALGRLVDPALTALAQAATAADLRLVLITSIGNPLGDVCDWGPPSTVALPRPVRPSRLVQALAVAPAARPRVRVVRETAAAVARVLIVEDDAVSQQVFAHYVAELGLTADVVESGEAAVTAALSGAYELVLMDWHLGDLDGGTVATAIRVSEPPGRRVPIVAVSGAAEPEFRERCLAAGMDEVLLKPVTLELLRQTLRRVLAADASPTTSNLDPLVVERLRRLQPLGQPDVVASLLRVYRVSAARHLTGLRTAIATGDRAAARRAAHTLRGSTASLGLTGVMPLVDRLHRLTETGRLDGAVRLVDEIEAAIDRLPTTAVGMTGA